jgi:hypothetical protein
MLAALLFISKAFLHTLISFTVSNNNHHFIQSLLLVIFIYFSSLPLNWFNDVAETMCSVRSFAGSISLTLGTGPSSLTRAVTTGLIVAFGDGRDALWQAPITGNLNCGTSEFAGMTAPPSTQIWAGSQLGATLQGKFDSAALALGGQITLRSATQAQCISTWRAVGSR